MAETGPTRVVTREAIQAFVDEIVARFHPERVILFGSRAYGEPHQDSDVDLLVVMECEGPWGEMATRIRNAIRSGFPMDLLVRPQSFVEQRVAMDDDFFQQIVAQGQVLYAAHH